MAGLMQITLYNEESEPIQTYSQGFVPWRLLKAAVKLAGSMDQNNLKEEDLDALAGLVVEVFGNKFSVDDLNAQADVGEMMTVLTAIIGKASGGIGGNPTKPG